MGRAFEYRRASKEARWDKMSKLFPKLAKAIQVAAKEGGSDPTMNAKLRSTIATAKAANMPKNNIEAAIKRACGKDAADIKTIFYEARAPHGVQMIIECMSDNPTRTVANVKAILNKNKAEMLQNGALSFMFDKKAIFYLESVDEDLDELELFLIDYGLLELKSEGDELILLGEATAFKTLSDALDEKNLNFKEAYIAYVANSPLSLNEDEHMEIDKILDKLEDDEDVHHVYTNIGE